MTHFWNRGLVVGWLCRTVGTFRKKMTLRKNVVLQVFLLTLITYSIVPNSYSIMLVYVPESQSAPKTTPNTTVSIAANSPVLVFNKTKSGNALSSTFLEVSSECRSRQGSSFSMTLRTW
jgi:hypothetical protein